MSHLLNAVLQMVEGLSVQVALKKSPLEGNVAYIVPSNTSLLALLQKLITVQNCWDSFSRWGYSTALACFCMAHEGAEKGGVLQNWVEQHVVAGMFNMQQVPAWRCACLAGGVNST